MYSLTRYYISDKKSSTHCSNISTRAITNSMHLSTIWLHTSWEEIHKIRKTLIEGTFIRIFTHSQSQLSSKETRNNVVKLLIIN